MRTISNILLYLSIVGFSIVAIGAAAQLSFNSGQQSELMKYRIDVDNHSMASEQLTNIIVKAKGMAAKRPGTEFIDESLTEDDVRLIPFEFSTDDSYILEFSHESIAFFRTVP